MNDARFDELLKFPPRGLKTLRGMVEQEEGARPIIYIFKLVSSKAGAPEGLHLHLYYRQGQDVLKPASLKSFLLSSLGGALRARDRLILRTLHESPPPVSQSVFVLEGPHLDGVLPLFEGLDNAFVETGKRPLRFAPAPPRPVLSFTQHRLMLGCSVRMRLHDGALAEPGELVFLCKGSPWFLAGEMLYRLPPQAQAALEGVFRDGAWDSLIIKKELPELFQALIPRLKGLFEIEMPPDMAIIPVTDGSPEFVLFVEERGGALQGTLKVRYGASDFALAPGGEPESVFCTGEGEKARWVRRHLAKEREVTGRVMACGFVYDAPSGNFTLEGRERIWEFLVSHREMVGAGVTVMLAKSVKPVSLHEKPVEMRVRLRQGAVAGALDMDVTFEAGKLKVPLHVLEEAVAAGRKYVELDGSLVRTRGAQFKEFLASLRELPRKGSEYSLHPWSLPAVMDAAGAGDRVELAGEAHVLWERLRGAAPVETPALPPEAQACIRPYQRDGVKWLRTLGSLGFSGILADDMGLGKTLQALLHLLFASHERPGIPSLVVCPRSVVYNWADEAEKFTPELRVLPLEGDRERRAQAIAASADVDVVVTSYQQALRDVDELSSREWNVLVLDEAQNIRNAATRTAEACKALRAASRLAITGTPVENSLADLWSIFDFLMPGFLGTMAQFNGQYGGAGDGDGLRRLSQRIAPFVKRRLKEQVAPELPESIEMVHWCDMTQEQRALYAKTLERARRELGGGDPGKSRMAVLAALTRLRQICCHPALLDRKHLGRDDISGKLDAFADLLETILAGGHRVLVFSQFVEMLTLLREFLRRQGIPHYYLDGATPARERTTMAKEFNESPAVPAFLISLKAGGTGLNLTGADYVIHFDPWWNPAVERQATDRAHRIGQARTVFSYRLVTRGSVEERVRELQAEKAHLFDSVMDGEERLLSSLTAEDMARLLTM